MKFLSYGYLLMLWLGAIMVTPAETLQLKNGVTLECQSVTREGNFLRVSVAGGGTKIPKENLSAEEWKKYFPDEKTEEPPEKKKSSFKDWRAPVKPRAIPAATAPIADQIEVQQPAVSAAPASETGNIREDFLPAQLPPRPEKIMRENYQVKKVEYSLPCKMANQKKVVIQALVPVDEFGKVPASASNIVFYAPVYMGSPLHKSRGHDQRIYWELCEHYGFTVFSASYNTKLEDMDEREKCYYYPESGAFEPVFTARERLIREFNLDRKKMYIIGNSGGSSMAERLGLLYPDEIAAIVLMGGGRYDPVDKKVDIPWLVINTRGDPRAEENQELVEQLRVKGMNALYTQTTPAVGSEKDFERQNDQNFHHTVSRYAFDLAREFIANTVEINNNPKSTSWTPAQWLCYAPADDVCRVSDNTVPAVEKDVYIQKFFFPSKEFAALWQSMPYRVFQLDDPTKENTDGKLEIWARYPVSVKPPKGIILYNGGGNGLDAYVGDEMDFMSLKGYLVITANFSSGELNKLRQTEKMVGWTLAQSTLKQLPIYLLGMKNGGRHMLLGSCKFNDTRIQAIYVVNPPLEWPFPELSPMEHASELKADVFLLALDNNQNQKIQAYGQRVTQAGHDITIDNSINKDENLTQFKILGKMLLLLQ
jgi:hypothetical protein